MNGCYEESGLYFCISIVQIYREFEIVFPFLNYEQGWNKYMLNVGWKEHQWKPRDLVSSVNSIHQTSGGGLTNPSNKKFKSDACHRTR